MNSFILKDSIISLRGYRVPLRRCRYNLGYICNVPSPFSVDRQPGVLEKLVGGVGQGYACSDTMIHVHTLFPPLGPYTYTYGPGTEVRMAGLMRLAIAGPLFHIVPSLLTF